MKVFFRMKVLYRLFPFLILTVLVISFFFPLFYPVPQIFVTPDSTLSDILHFFYPTKFLLSEALKHNTLPIWTDMIGTGFPLIGESQIEALSVINLILFKYFPLITAFNLQYVILFLGLALGMYLVARELGWSKLTGIYCAIIYTFSGLIIVKIPHLNCLQALSYVPFIFWILLRMQKNKHTVLWLFLPFLLSQQILQGHFQYIFISYLFFLGYFYLLWWKKEKKDRLFLIKKSIIIGLLTFGLASSQLFPSFEYFVKSGGRDGLANNILGAYQFKHLFQFFYPYILGDNRIGTYPATEYGLGFLETFSYIGLIPILLAISSLWLWKKNEWIRTCWILIIIFFLFVFEKNSPFYILFTFPPFSWFRVHSRFLSNITLLLVLLSGYVFELLYTNKIRHVQFLWKKLWQYNNKKIPIGYSICIILFIISVIDVLSFATSYQPIRPISEVEKLPPLLKNIPDGSRIITIPYANTPWLRTMYTNGWKDINDYLHFLNDGRPNFTALHAIDNLSIYAGFLPVKQVRMLSIPISTSDFDVKTNVGTLSASAINTFRLQNTEYLITPYHLSNQETTFVVKGEQRKNFDPYIIYKLSGIKPKYYLTSSYISTRFIEEYEEALKKPNILSSEDAFISTDRKVPKSNNGSVTILSDKPTEKTFSLSIPGDQFFVASVYFYPGWEATLDGKKTTIIPANLSGMAVFVPKGDHILMLHYIPWYLYMGIGISLITSTIYGYSIIRSVSQTSH